MLATESALDDNLLLDQAAMDHSPLLGPDPSEANSDEHLAATLWGQEAQRTRQSRERALEEAEAAAPEPNLFPMESSRSPVAAATLARALTRASQPAVRLAPSQAKRPAARAKRASQWIQPVRKRIRLHQQAEATPTDPQAVAAGGRHTPAMPATAAALTLPETPWWEGHSLNKALIWTEADAQKEFQRPEGARSLGSGTFARVSVRVRRGYELVALKTYNEDTTCKERMRECLALEQVAQHQHPNLIQIIGVVMGQGNIPLGVLLPYCSQTLAEYQAQRFGILLRHEAADLSWQLFSAIAHIHKVSILHRDVKPANILIKTSTRNSLRLILADFGSARGISSAGSTEGTDEALVKPALLATPGVCTWPWRAPEVHMDLPYGRGLDVCSGGVVAFTLFSGHMTFWGSLVPGLACCMLLCGPITEQTWPGCSKARAWRHCPEKPLALPWPPGPARWRRAESITRATLQQRPEDRASAADTAEQWAKLRRPHRVNEKGPSFTPPLGRRVPLHITPATPQPGGLAGRTSRSPSKAPHTANRCQCTGDGRYCNASGHSARTSSVQCSSLASRGQFCEECACAEPTCKKRRLKLEYCRDHWHLSSKLPLELRCTRLFRTSLPHMIPLDLTTWTEASTAFPPTQPS